MIMTIKELAKRANVSESQVRGWINKYGLPVTKVGKRVLIQLASFTQWLAAHEEIREPTPCKDDFPAYEHNSKIAHKIKKIY